MITDIGLATMASILIYFGYVYGFTSVLMYYWIPYMVNTHANNVHGTRILTFPFLSCVITGKRFYDARKGRDSFNGTLRIFTGLVSHFPPRSCSVRHSPV